MLPLEDWAGLIGSILLLYAPGRDQLLRFFSYLLARKEISEPRPGVYRSIIEAALERERNKWSFWDTLFMSIGAIMLGLSYVLPSVNNLGTG